MIIINKHIQNQKNKHSAKVIFCIISVIMILILNLTLSTSAVTIDRYFDGVGTVGMGDGFMFQRSYRSYFQMETFGFTSGVPLYDNTEDEIRITNNYLPINIPFTIHEGLQTTSNYDGSNIGVGVNSTTTGYQHSESIYTAYDPSLLISSVGQADEYGNSDRIKSATFQILKRDSTVPPTLYLRGSVFGTTINDTTYSFHLNLNQPYNLYVKGSFSLFSNAGNLETFAISNKVIECNGRYVFDIESVLGSALVQTLSQTHRIKDWVFSGSILVSPLDSTASQFPTIRVYYDTTHPIIDEATNFVYSSNYDAYSALVNDPIVSYFEGSQTSPPETVQITENGIYNIVKPSYVNVNVPQTLEWSGLFDWMFDTMGAFMGFEIAPGWTLGIIMTIVIGLSISIWVLKVFLGG